MIENYLKIAFRNILKNKVQSLVNVFGLAVGLAACLFLYLYVQNDMSFDKFNTNYEKIYRVVQEFKQNGKTVIWAPTPTGYANAFPLNFPGVKAVRISLPLGGDAVVKSGEKLFSVRNFMYADSSFFGVFSLPLIIGDPTTALSDPFSIVVSQSEARKLFGSIDPLGKIIRIDNQFNFTVTGVAKDTPLNSSIQFGYLASFVSLRDIYQKDASMYSGGFLNNFSNYNFYTFLLLPSGMRIETIRSNLPSFLTKIFGAHDNYSGRLLLQPFSSIHFNSTYLFDVTNKGDLKYDYILSGIALLILSIACINFINISTARSASRAKEIGIRKVLGSSRSKLLWQFILEFAAIALVSLVFAIVIVEMLMPEFNSVANTHLTASVITDPGIILPYTGIWLLIVLLASAYPSLHLTSFQPAAVMKSSIISGNKGGFVRKSLIVFQFAISVFLIAATIIIWSQYDFLKQHKLGFDANQVVFLPSNNEVSRTYEAFKSQLLQQRGIQNVSRANWVPGNAQNIGGYSWTNATGEHSEGFYRLIVDPDYAKVLGFTFVSGRNFSWHIASDWNASFVLNETAAKLIGWTPQSALGQTLKHSSDQLSGRVIGVVKDFNFKSLQKRVEPVILSMDSSATYYNTIAIKISQTDIPGTMNVLESTWRQFAPDLPFDYHFLDQSFEQLYRSEERLSELFGVFALLAIIIACLGLFSLVSYVVQQRTKEVSIRKVLGASVPQVVYLIIKDFIKLVFIGSVIAWLPVYYFMANWLDNFAYRIHISLLTFAYSGLIALLIALVTVSIHLIKAANANPVESLRYE